MINEFPLPLQHFSDRGHSKAPQKSVFHIWALSLFNKLLKHMKQVGIFSLHFQVWRHSILPVIVSFLMSSIGYTFVCVLISNTLTTDSFGHQLV